MHLTTKIAELLKVQPAGALIDIVTDQRDGYLDFGARLGTEHVKNVPVGEPGNGSRDFGPGLVQVIDDHLVDIGEMRLEFHAEVNRLSFE